MSRNHDPLAAAEPAPWVKTKMRAGRFFGALTGNQTLGRSLTAEKNQDRSGKVSVQEQNGGRENGSGRQTLFGARGTAGLPDPPVAAEMKHEPKTGSGKRKQLLGRTLSKERKCRHGSGSGGSSKIQDRPKTANDQNQNRSDMKNQRMEKQAGHETLRQESISPLNSNNIHMKHKGHRPPSFDN
jgi:hypothetical protein